MATALLAALDQFTSPNDTGQLRKLEDTLCKVIPAHCGETEVCALLAVFERFPEGDGLGTFWSIVHLLESCDGYERFLVQSVRRKPNELNVLMVNRLINGGVSSVEGHSLLALLFSVSTNSDSKSVREAAEKLVTHQTRIGRAGS